MKDVSNKTLVGLLTVALIVSLLGVLTSINQFQDIFTGAATSTSTGKTNVTITSTTSLTNQVSDIDFGSGYVNASCEFCIMDTNQSVLNMFSNASNQSTVGTAGTLCCLSFTSVTSGFLIENTGNKNLSVGYTCSGNCTHASFIGGTLNGEMGGLEIKVNPNNIRVQSGETGGTDAAASCAAGGVNGYFYWNAWNMTNLSSYSSAGIGGDQGKYISLSDTGHWLCGNRTNYPLDFDNTKDAAVIDINITIPNDAPATSIESSFTLTFNGTSP